MIPGITAGGRNNPWKSIPLPVTLNARTLYVSDTLMQLLVGTGTSYTLYESDDGGLSWPRSFPVTFTTSANGRITKTPDTTFLDGYSGIRGRYRVDGPGNAFTNSSPEPVGNTLVNDVMYEPTNDILLMAAGTDQVYAYTSADRGRTWVNRLNNVATGYPRSPVYVAGRYNMVTSNGNLWSTSVANASSGWTSQVIDAAANLSSAIGVGNTLYCWDSTGKLYAGADGAVPTQVTTTSILRGRAVAGAGKVFSRTVTPPYFLLMGDTPVDIVQIPGALPVLSNVVGVANGNVYALESGTNASRIFYRPIPT